ncbi:hypothetical protein JPSP26_24530 [Staphylococcus pseudintermedius]|nr:hypothetical protein [Staphylococcus phage phiSP119-2]
MKTIYVILILIIWLNVILGNDISDSVIALVVTLVLLNIIKGGPNGQNKRNH